MSLTDMIAVLTIYVVICALALYIASKILD
jgi:hypothetical protein